MTIIEFADIIDRELVVRYYPNQKGRFCAQFDRSDTKKTKQSSVIGSCFGDGNTPIAALNEYARQLTGMVLVFDASYGEGRVEYIAPPFTPLIG
jgi:hypothetical protein